LSELGAQDTREEALAYCKRLAAGRAPDELIETFVDTGHQMVRYLEERTPLRFHASLMPDYRSEEAGAKLGGRTLEADMFAKAELGEWESRLRPSPLMFMPLTIDEQLRGLARPKEIPVNAIVERMEQGLVGSGNALVGRLLKGCLDRGIEILLETRARELVRPDFARLFEHIDILSGKPGFAPRFVVPADEPRQVQCAGQPRRPRADNQHIRVKSFAIIRHIV